MKLLLLAQGLFPLLALAGDPVAQLTFHVVTDDGRAVTGAPVVMATAEGWRPGKTDYGYTQMREVRGVTDAGGFVTLKLPCKTGNIRRYAVEGVYDRATKMEFGGAVYYVDRGRSFSFTNQVGNKWQPWNPTVELQIMRVENPIPMYARSYVNSIPGLYMPDVGKPVGFDLMKGDWIAPHGSGETCDVIFKLDVTSLGQRKIDRGPMFDAVFRSRLQTRETAFKPSMHIRGRVTPCVRRALRRWLVTRINESQPPMNMRRTAIARNAKIRTISFASGRGGMSRAVSFRRSTERYMVKSILAPRAIYASGTTSTQLRTTGTWSLTRRRTCSRICLLWSRCAIRRAGLR